MRNLNDILNSSPADAGPGAALAGLATWSESTGRGHALEGMRQPSYSAPFGSHGSALAGIEDPGRWVPAELVPWLGSPRPEPLEIHIVHHIVIQEDTSGEDRRN